MRPKLLGLLVASILTLGSPVAGDDQPPSETDRVKLIKDLLRDLRPPELVDFLTEDGVYHQRPPEWVQWCEQFRDDFAAQHGVEHVEPVAQSDRYDDPVFGRWQERCPTLAFNARSEPWVLRHLPPGPRGDWLRKLPQHMPDGSKILDYQYGTRDFRLFVGDFDNDPDDAGAEELIFFSDGFYSYWELIARDERFALTVPPLDRSWNDVVSPDKVPTDLFIDISADYRLLNLHHCRSTRLANVFSRYYTMSQEGEVRLNGLIRYRGQYYFFELELDDPYRLDVEALRPQRVPTNGHPVEMPEPPYCWFQ